MKVKLPNGVAIRGSVEDALPRLKNKFPLIIADPPYGNIVVDGWDKVDIDDKRFAQWMFGWTNVMSEVQPEGGAAYVWGGVGITRFRPFFRFMADVENETPYSLSTQITWSKKRAYGIQWGYLFTREEIAFLVKGDHKKPKTFNVPLLDKKRGYEGYNEKYPAKSEFLRRTNVWVDITEVFRGKKHTAEKPKELSKVMIETHTSKGDRVLDLFSGSGNASKVAQEMDRRFVAVERDPDIFDKLVEYLK